MVRRDCTWLVVTAPGGGPAVTVERAVVGGEGNREFGRAVEHGARRGSRGRRRRGGGRPRRGAGSAAGAQRHGDWVTHRFEVRGLVRDRGVGHEQVPVVHQHREVGAVGRRIDVPGRMARDREVHSAELDDEAAVDVGRHGGRGCTRFGNGHDTCAWLGAGDGSPTCDLAANVVGQRRGDPLRVARQRRAGCDLGASVVPSGDERARGQRHHDHEARGRCREPLAPPDARSDLGLQGRRRSCGLHAGRAHVGDSSLQLVGAVAVIHRSSPLVSKPARVTAGT